MTYPATDSGQWGVAGLADADADHTRGPYGLLQQPLSRSPLVTMDSRESPAADAVAAVAADEKRSTSIVLMASAILNLDIQIIPFGIDVMGVSRTSPRW